MARTSQAAASGRSRRAAGRRGIVAGADRAALLLLAAWVVYRLYPYMPALDVGKYWRAVRPVLWDPLPHGSDPFRLCLTWLLCCMLVEAAVGAARTVRLFPIFAGAIFAARILIVDNVLSSADVAGACVAYVLWLLVFRRAPARNGILAAFVAAMLFATRMEGEHGFAWITLVDKAFLYGGLVWLLVRSGMRVVVATLATAVLLLAAGVAASHGHVHPNAFGDPAVAVCAGALVALCALSLPRRSRP